MDVEGHGLRQSMTLELTILGMPSSDAHPLKLDSGHALVVLPEDPDERPFVSAASGLVRVGAFDYVVADDELFLARFPVDRAIAGRRFRLFPGSLPNAKRERKRAKPDFEALVALGPTRLLAVPSGSRPNRARGALIDLDSRSGDVVRTQIVDFDDLYTALRRNPRLESLNIEGACVQGLFLTLFHRGNSRGAVNAIIDLHLAEVMTAFDGPSVKALPPRAFHTLHSIALGSLDGIPLGFTDAATVSPDLVAFSAAAEATDDAYDDAPFSGSIVGLLYGEPGGPRRLEAAFRCDAPVKVEGLHVESCAGHLSFTMVTDADDAEVPALFYVATLT